MLRDSEMRVCHALETLSDYMADSTVALRLSELAGMIEYEKIKIRESIANALTEGRRIQVEEEIAKLNSLIDDLDMTLLGAEIV